MPEGAAPEDEDIEANELKGKKDKKGQEGEEGQKEAQGEGGCRRRR